MLYKRLIAVTFVLASLSACSDLMGTWAAGSNSCNNPNLSISLKDDGSVVSSDPGRKTWKKIASDKILVSVFTGSATIPDYSIEYEVSPNNDYLYSKSVNRAGKKEIIPPAKRIKLKRC